MTKHIMCYLRPRFHAVDENAETGYLELPKKTIDQLGIKSRLVNGSKKDGRNIFLKSGDDLRLFANEMFSRTGYRLINGCTLNPVVPGDYDDTKTITFTCDRSSSGNVLETIEKLPNVAKPRKEIKPGDKLPLPKNLQFRFYSDPGHGWLAVRMNLIYALGIQDQISGYSYRTGDTAYLEEDGDLSTFARAMEARGFPFAEINKNIQYKHLESSSEGNYIRRMRSYVP